jgi:hypothetical protein
MKICPLGEDVAYQSADNLGNPVLSLINYNYFNNLSLN